MDIEILGSGSDGNCYIIHDGATNLMIDCGIPMQEIKTKTNFFEEPIEGCLISHSHGDHILSAGDLMKYGIQCYMSFTTLRESKIAQELLKARATQIKHNKEFEIGTFTIRPLNLNHDVHCLGFLIYSNVTKERLFFATDTSFIRYVIPPVDYIMIETNYDLDILNSRIQGGDTDMAAKDRLVKSHMSIATAIDWLESQNLSKCRRIYLMHLSEGSSNEEQFKRRVMEATGCPVSVC